MSDLQVRKRRTFVHLIAILSLPASRSAPAADHRFPLAKLAKIKRQPAARHKPANGHPSRFHTGFARCTCAAQRHLMGQECCASCRSCALHVSYQTCAGTCDCYMELLIISPLLGNACLHARTAGCCNREVGNPRQQKQHEAIAHVTH